MEEQVTNPVEVEKELLNKVAAEKEAAIQRNPEDVAAAMFSMYFPIFHNVTKKLSNKQLRRILNALVEVPLNGKEYKMLKKDEKEVFQIGSALLESKWQMMLYALQKHHEELTAKQAEETKETPNESGTAEPEILEKS